MSASAEGTLLLPLCCVSAVGGMLSGSSCGSWLGICAARAGGAARAASYSSMLSRRAATSSGSAAGRVAKEGGCLRRRQARDLRPLPCLAAAMIARASSSLPPAMAQAKASGSSTRCPCAELVDPRMPGICVGWRCRTGGGRGSRGDRGVPGAGLLPDAYSSSGSPVTGGVVPVRGRRPGSGALRPPILSADDSSRDAVRRAADRRVSVRPSGRGGSEELESHCTSCGSNDLRPVPRCGAG